MLLVDDLRLELILTLFQRFLLMERLSRGRGPLAFSRDLTGLAAPSSAPSCQQASEEYGL